MTPTAPLIGPDESPRERKNYPLLVWTGVGVVLMVTNKESASFGWFAYAPLSGDTFVPALSVFTLQQKIGLATGGIGLAILVFCAGWSFGRSRSSDKN